MAVDNSLVERVAALEVAVRELQGAFSTRTPAPDWLDRIIGSMKDEPAFDEVLAHGKTLRHGDRPSDELVP